MWWPMGGIHSIFDWLQCTSGATHQPELTTSSPCFYIDLLRISGEVIRRRSERQIICSVMLFCNVQVANVNVFDVVDSVVTSDWLVADIEVCALKNGGGVVYKDHVLGQKSWVFESNTLLLISSLSSWCTH